MEKSATFLIELACPDCGRTGTAHASSAELQTTNPADIHLDQIPFGFLLTGEPGMTIRCDCGNTFRPKRT